jgi:folate-binding protein YgfZ
MGTFTRAPTNGRETIDAMTACDPLTAELLAGGPWVRGDAPYRLLSVAGPDAGDFLQRLCSQDLLALAAGGLQPAAFLDARGKVAATCLAMRAADGFLLECQAAQLERLQQLLERYHFTEKLRIDALPGRASERLAAATATGRVAVAIDASGVVAVAFARRGVQFERWHARGDAMPPALPGAPLDDARAECLRMGAGLVRVGVDTEPQTLALEADLADHCSLTKGCYTGQEIVARINTYGHTNRALCLLHLEGSGAIDAPRTLHELDDGIAVGRVMRAVQVPGRELRVGLGYLPKDFQAIGTRLRLDDGGPVTVAGFAPQS